ncbi:unnamed protein product [Dimorphilus gyrociliatus]|uniref:Uncharacterized protein n=1 Tax=Dimorphilus gyrociliatus TaxID=2664684 RepID=A0A7I8WEP1_9ANNE|nr:unnamed protein product [Dimorphilus gyrociliatus]
MIYFLIILNLLGSVKFSNLESIYRNCKDALESNNFIDSMYSIQPVPNGTIAGITCSLTAEDEIITEIGNDVEQNKRLTVQSGTLSIKIKYANLTNTELRVLIKSSGICSQQMSLTLRNVHDKFISFTFLDGKVYKLRHFNDGICQCLTSEICDKLQNRMENCKNVGKNQGYSQSYDLSGEISVLPHRLPLIQTRYGDINGGQEYAKHHIGPLSCSMILKLKSPLILNSYCKNYNSSFLNDNDSTTCIKFKTKFVKLKLDYTEKINFTIGKESVFEIHPYVNTSIGKISLCNQDTPTSFTCSSYSRYIYVSLWTTLSNDIEVCEIQNLT